MWDWPARPTPILKHQVNASMHGAAVLNIAKFPEAVFVIQSALKAPGKPTGEVTFYDLQGEFTLHGVKRPLHVQARTEAMNGMTPAAARRLRPAANRLWHHAVFQGLWGRRRGEPGACLVRAVDLNPNAKTFFPSRVTMITCETVQKRQIHPPLRSGHALLSIAVGSHIHHGLWQADESPETAQQHLTETLADLAEIRGGETIVDVGCGMGRLGYPSGQNAPVPRDGRDAKPRAAYKGAGPRPLPRAKRSVA